ncbi:SpaH/EbpB family LPXTG-anchored major pilin [Enterococcus faecium]|nr:SpaH/EbpB family LPXTG-anchored major pilin [Enterococcus faecium]
MNKKMIVTGMSVLLLVTAGIGSFGNGKLVQAEEVAQKPSEVTITLHKKGFSTVPEERPNSGLVSTDFGEENIPGVDFDLFDVTEVYYDLIRDNPLTPEREDGLNSAEAIEWIQKRHTESWFLKYRLTSIDKQTTNEAGEAVFSTVQVTEEAPSSRDKVYLFLETYSPAHISRIASPMVVMMPVMMPDMVDGVWDGSTWKDTYNTDVHLYPKNEIREADKQMNVEESDLRQVTIINEAGEQETISYIDLERGKTASYTITAPIPYFIDSVLESGSAVIKNYKITDTPTVGLTYYDQEIEVRAGETILTKGQDYIVEVVNNGFVVTILTEENGIAKVDTLGRLADARGGDLTITYNLKVSTELEADDFHNNTAVIEIGRNDEFDYEEGVEPPEKVTTGGRKFEKYDASSSELLKDARFELWNEDRSEYAIFYKGESPLAVYESGADRIEWATSGQATEFFTDGNGYFEVQGLDYGTYQMKETMAPEGYVLPTGEAAFTEFIITYGSYNEEIQIVGVENPGPERVPNMKRGSLPATGGNGLLAFLLIGISLMIGAYSWYRKSKMKSEV